VRATTRQETPSYFSNGGVKPDGNVVSAPGGGGCEDGVLSTVPTTWASPEWGCPAPPGYAYLNGTSMAAPHAAGVAALLAAQGRTRDQIVAVLTGTARDPATGERGRHDPLLGYGIVDAEAAVVAPGGTPPPTTTTTTTEPPSTTTSTTELPACET
jgi:subtilisin family serine protease